MSRPGLLALTAIWDAIARLTSEGLIETKPQSYTRVTEVVAKDVEDAAAVLGAMHDLAVHAIPLAAYGNAAASGTVDRYTSLVRRAERLLFTSPQAGRSVRLHDDLISALADHDVARATAVNAEIWSHLHPLTEGLG